MVYLFYYPHWYVASGGVWVGGINQWGRQHSDFASHLKLLLSNAAFENADLGASLYNYNLGR